MASVPPDVVKQVNDLVQNEDMPALKKVEKIAALAAERSLLQNNSAPQRDTDTPSQQGWQFA
jgi:hypothetical protein